MFKHKTSQFEKQLNSILTHQDKELASIQFTASKQLDSSIAQSEELLRSLGYDPANYQSRVSTEAPAKEIIVPSWNELCKKAEQHVGMDCSLMDLFTAEELKSNEVAIQQLNNEYNVLHHLDAIDISIAVIAGIIGAAVDILLVGVPEKSKSGLDAGPLSDYIRDYFDKILPEEEMKKLANSKVSKVPYDAQDNRNTTIDVEGLSTYYHRLLQLGHDPLLGFIIGVIDIKYGRMTTIDKGGKFVSQVMKNYANRKETDIFAAIAKQFIHFKTDVTTSMGLPVPLMALFNLFQFGSIGEEEQTIAEIVQGMYYQGYDFIHFCSMSVPTMIIEVIVRLSYALKHLKEGHCLKDSIPISTNRTKHPKLKTMLFIAHSAAVAINSGKVYFAKNPVAINYPEWLAFAQYAYSQLKWAIIEKPSRRRAYIENHINSELKEIYEKSETTFSSFSENYEIVFH